MIKIYARAGASSEYIRFDNVVVSEPPGSNSRYAIASGNWSEGNTWSTSSGGASCCCTPDANSEVHIENGYIVNMNATGSTKDITVYSGGELRYTGSYVALDVYNSGTVTINSGGYINGNGQTDPEIDFADATTCSLIVNDATNGLNVTDIDIDGGGTLYISGSGKITLTDNFVFNSGGKVTNNLTGTFTITNFIAMDGGAKFTNNDSITLTTGSLRFESGSNNDTIVNNGYFSVANDLAFYGINSRFINNAAGQVDVADALGCAASSDDNNKVVNYGTMNISGNLTAGDADFSIENHGTFDLNGNISSFPTTGTRDIYNYAGSTFKWAGTTYDSDMRLYCNYDANTFQYDLAGAQPVIVPTDNYWHLKASISGTKSTDGSITVAGDLTIEGSAVLDIGTGLDDLTLKGAFTITSDAADPLVEGSQTFTCSSTANQTLTGAIDYYNLTINKASGTVTLGSAITVTNALTLTSGKIDLSNYNLTIGSSGSISGGSSSTFIATTGTGYLRQEGIGSGSRTGAILFPVGSTTSSYTPVTIDNSSGTADRFDVKVCNNVYNDGNCSGGTQETEYVINKTWTINEGVATGSNASITLQWNASDEGTNFDRANCRMSHYNGSGWEYLHVDGAASGSDPYTRTATGVSDFSPFGMGGGGGNPLPIELTEFTAELIEGAVFLKWQTLTEINNDYFTIERSADAIQFEEIETIPGAGNSHEEKNYAIVDHYPLSGVSYYRLKQTDYDGSFEYSDIVAVKNDRTQEEFAVKMSPNPSDGRIKLDVSGVYNDNVSIAVYNPYGEELYFESWFMTGATALIIDLNENLASGTYIVTAESGSSLWSEKLIVR